MVEYFFCKCSKIVGGPPNITTSMFDIKANKVDKWLKLAIISENDFYLNTIYSADFHYRKGIFHLKWAYILGFQVYFPGYKFWW